MRDLIFVSLEDWDDVWRRNQFVCAGLARRYPGTRILFVGLPRDVSNGIRRGRLGELLRKRGGPVPRLPNITLTHCLKLAPNTVACGRRFNEALERAHVRRAARQAGLRDPILWLNPHSAVHMAGCMGERAVIYDITDDWISLTQSRALRDLTAAQDQALCRRADAVIVCSQKLYELKRDLARRLFLVPNGVDAEHYEQVSRDDLPLPSEARCWPRPVLGYTGTVHPDRVDVGLLQSLTEALKQGSVVLIGPNHLPAADRQRLESRGNLFFQDAVPYARLPEYMRAFDVCITPHRVTPFTESLNPIKLWEYLAAGKPIVSTPVAGFRDYPRLVHLAESADQFLAAAHAGLRESPGLAGERRAEARRHSWDARLDQIEQVLTSCTAPSVPEVTSVS